MLFKKHSGSKCSLGRSASQPPKKPRIRYTKPLRIFGGNEDDKKDGSDGYKEASSGNEGMDEESLRLLTSCINLVTLCGQGG
jgi:hypothetical protein